MKKITFSALLLASAVCFAQPSELLESARQGDAAAQSILGAMFSLGQGVAKNDAEAVQWYRRAAEQGDASAQLVLGGLLSQGKGVAQNYEEGYFWLLLAGAHLEDGRRLRDLVQTRLSASQVAKVQAQAAAWKPKQANPR